MRNRRKGHTSECASPLESVGPGRLAAMALTLVGCLSRTRKRGNVNAVLLLYCYCTVTVLVLEIVLGNEQTEDKWK